jgi:hypothetical protein
MAEELTVIIVELLGGKATKQCVQAVRSQTGNLLIVRRDGSTVDEEGRLVEGPGVTGIPAKRRRAVELARSPLVALLEDIVVPSDGWAGAVCRSFHDSAAVACGGPVQIGAELPASSRALALSEYGTYGPCRIAAEVPSLPGCNFAFRRPPLLRAMSGTEGFVDGDVFHALREDGGRMVWAPEMSVTFSHPFPEGARLKTRFDHGRLYGSSSKSRALSAAKAPLLPMVLTARAIGARNSLPGLSTIGWLLLQQTAWAAGEFVGALAGLPKGGFARWR